MTQTITIQGPFSEEEIARIIALVGDIESERPDETFEVFFTAPHTGIDKEGFMELLERINPLRPGYGRKVVSLEMTDSHE